MAETENFSVDRLDKQELLQRLNRYVRQIFGVEPDEHNLNSAFFGAFAHTIATKVHEGFVAKSRHEVDELGVKWKDLDPKTKAYSRPDARVDLYLPGPKSRPTLKENQDRAWRWQFATALEWYRTQMSEDEAKREAAKLAWAYVKRHLGAQTLLELTASKMLPLLQKTGRLASSLAPGDFDGKDYDPPPEQVYRRSNSGLTWGSGVEYASRVSEKRPLWADSIDPWIDDALEAGINATVDLIREELAK